ncbi:MAG TPA: DUF177 domain-containing protein [Chitinivibrionales bacterium]|nr:DUF177 domain-containing protein [Chitinivibrionales bacterium]
MRINIHRVPEGRSVVTQDVTAADDNAQGLVLDGAVSCTADLDRIQAQIHARVRFACTLRLQCSRCLGPVRQSVQGEFRLVMQEKSRSGGRNHLPEEEVDLVFDDASGDVDLSPFIFDEILLSVPMKPLCSEECRGIGIQGDSAISVEYRRPGQAVDPRWKALERLRNKAST